MLRFSTPVVFVVKAESAYCDAGCDADAGPTVAAESEIHNVAGCTSTTTQLVTFIYSNYNRFYNQICWVTNLRILQRPCAK